MILAIPVFNDIDFLDRIMQNIHFSRIIWTSFSERGGFQEARKEARRSILCGIPQARIIIMKSSCYIDDMKNLVLDDKSWTKIRIQFSQKRHRFSQSTRFKAFSENNNVLVEKR